MKLESGMKYDNLDKFQWIDVDALQSRMCPFQKAPDFSIERIDSPYIGPNPDYRSYQAFAKCAGYNCNALIQHPEDYTLGYCALIPQPLFSPISVVDKSKTVKSVVLPKEALQIFCDNFLEFGQTSTAFKDIVDLYKKWSAQHGLTPVNQTTLRKYAKVGNQYLSFRDKKGIVHVVNVGLKRHDSA